MMNSHQNPATPSAAEQVNSVVNQQMCNVGGLFPNNTPVAAPPCFTNFPFPVQFPNGFVGGFNPQQNFSPFPPVNQFNPSPQQQGPLFVHNPMSTNQNLGLPLDQHILLLQNTVQNLTQLLQLQNPGNFPMFQNQIGNVLSHQNPGFPANHQNMGQQLQGNPFLPGASASVQTQTIKNLQNQIPQGVGPQGNNFHSNQRANSGQTQNPCSTLTNSKNQIPQGIRPQCNNFHSNQIANMGQTQNPFTNFKNQIPQGVGPQFNNFHSNQIDKTGQTQNPSSTLTNSKNQIPQSVGSQCNNFHSNQIANTGHTQNPCPALTNFKENHGNVPTKVNDGWAKSHHKNFTRPKINDASHKGFKTHKHVKEKFEIYNVYKIKDGNSNCAVDSGPGSSTKFEKKVPAMNYTEQEIKQWLEARKKNYPTNVNVLEKSKKGETWSDVTNQEATIRRQQLKEILAKQAELGCEVAEIPPSYLNSPDKRDPRDKKHERQQQYNKGKFHNKRGTHKFQDNRIAKRAKRSRDQNSFKHKPKERQPSLLEKLLTQDIKRDKNRLLQVFRFITLNSFFTSTEKSLRFPSVIVREETNPVVRKETSCSVVEGNNKSEEEEGEITD